MSGLDLERHLEFLARQRIAPAELFVMEAVGSGPAVEDVVIRLAARESQEGPLGAASAEECGDGLAACLNRGWLRVMDAEAIDEVESLVAAERLIGPVYGWPREGDVDFTPAGAEMLLWLRESLYGPDHNADFLYEVRKPAERRIKLYCRTLRAATRGLYAYEHHHDVIGVSDPRPIGPWCVWWWERFPLGYCLTADLAGGA